VGDARPLAKVGLEGLLTLRAGWLSLQIVEKVSETLAVEHGLGSSLASKREKLEGIKYDEYIRKIWFELLSGEQNHCHRNKIKKEIVNKLVPCGMLKGKT